MYTGLTMTICLKGQIDNTDWIDHEVLLSVSVYSHDSAVKRVFGDDCFRQKSIMSQDRWSRPRDWVHLW